MPTSILRGALAAAVALLAFATPAAAAAGAPAAPAFPSPSPSGAPTAPKSALALPRPTGPHRVGMTTLHLVDGSRPDPWVPEEKSRQLMVSLWYPARTSHGRRAPYMTAEESALTLKGQKITGVPGDALSKIRTNALVDVPPIGRRHAVPLVVLSPGFTMSRSSLTALAEDLASRGYIVAGIDHTHEAYGTTFPDGHTTTCVACDEQAEDLWKFGDKATRSRTADVSFVLDRLTGPSPAWKGGGLIDRSRIAMAGHSIGGNSSAWTMLNDSRVRAGINMDGTFFVPIPGEGLSRPFLMLGAGEVHEPGGKDFTWGRDWKGMTGWKRWLTLDGGDHGSFTDYPLLLEQSGIDLGLPVSGARSVEVTREYVGAFFDLHLRKRSQPLLERPSRRYPEVRFWS
ncbi:MULTISPECIES: alpha/beta hydrolase family protein [Streptosporangium]|uniref:Dienelactone hydrolase n=1 Tax=Streptosporangium brasiliense TaxID=47480 RepID=A0ABT9RBC1_9ACTN|nr:alpha/beta hydrolase [Streptosporangium brasiliense]MDP9865670.1 putative dienelactone hydrolase [Streptosporangium brasiliense]